eukprot:122988-Pleurochrysis_carterae.AAC.2
MRLTSHTYKTSAAESLDLYKAKILCYLGPDRGAHTCLPLPRRYLISLLGPTPPLVHSHPILPARAASSPNLTSHPPASAQHRSLALALVSLRTKHQDTTRSPVGTTFLERLLPCLLISPFFLSCCVEGKRCLVHLKCEAAAVKNDFTRFPFLGKFAPLQLALPLC